MKEVQLTNRFVSVMGTALTTSPLGRSLGGREQTLWEISVMQSLVSGGGVREGPEAERGKHSHQGGLKRQAFKPQELGKNESGPRP